MANGNLTFKDLREFDLNAYLERLGHFVDHVRGNNHWYHSPLREENTPSFKVNKKINRWFDHGIGKGGNLVDFGIRYFGCTPGEFMESFKNGHALQPLPKAKVTLIKEEAPENKIRVIAERPLYSAGLLMYLSQRHIPAEVAQRYCSEVEYELNGRQWFGIGFKNDAGGYEIRNPYFKGSSSPKAITSVTGRKGGLSVFEGFMDFLSFQSAFEQRPEVAGNYLVLNSLSFFEQAKPLMLKYEQVKLYLDHDKAGRELANEAVASDKRFKDKSGFYKDFKDINEWLIHDGQIRERRMLRKVR